jgi:hypothetical protein
MKNQKRENDISFSLLRLIIPNNKRQKINIIDKNTSASKIVLETAIYLSRHKSVGRKNNLK